MKLTTTATAEVVTRAITHFTDEIGEQLILCAADCPSMVHVAAQVGVPYRTLRYWLQAGREGDPRFEYFCAEFDKARSSHEARYLSNMEAIASQVDEPKTLAAAQRANEFLLRKLYPAQYSDQVFVSTMIERQADGYDLSVLPTDKLRDFMKMLKVIQADHEGADKEEIKRKLAKLNKGTNDKADGPASK